ncbi:MAG: tetratricopeptide repeat protein [Flavobacteriaceae bacterium]|nr:tetratricopeptide repeat protein [Flavobacteriaceae bacterium]
MKDLFYIIVLTTQVFFAQNGFENGNALYQKGKYQEAITAYESVFIKKKQSAELYFNIGNCYYKLNKVAPAIYNYEKALLLNPSDTEIQNNLEFAQKLQIDDIKTVAKVGFNKLIQDFTNTFHYNTWGGIAVGLSLLFLLFFIGYYFSQITVSKRLFFLGMFIVMLLLVVSVAAAIFEKNQYNNDQPAIVFSEVVSVKSEPKNGATDAFVIHEGTKVYVIESLDNWDKIQLTDGTEGWIENRAIKRLK